MCFKGSPFGSRVREHFDLPLPNKGLGIPGRKGGDLLYRKCVPHLTGFVQRILMNFRRLQAANSEIEPLRIKYLRTPRQRVLARL